MTTPFDKFNNNGSSVSGTSFGNIYETYRQTYSNIDSTYNALSNTSIYNYANTAKESTASKAMKWTNFSVGILGGLVSAGAGITSMVMMGKAMKTATQGARAAAGTQSSQSASVSEYVNNYNTEQLEQKRQDLTNKIADYTQKVSDANQVKVDSTAAARQAKDDYDAANTAYQVANKENIKQKGLASQAQTNVNKAQSRLVELSYKEKQSISNNGNSQSENDLTDAERAELAMLRGEATVKGSVKYYEKQKTDAEAEAKNQEDIMKTQKEKRSEQAKLQVEMESKAKTAQDDETKYKGLKEQAQTELSNISSAISQKKIQGTQEASQPEATEKAKGKKKSKKS